MSEGGDYTSTSWDPSFDYRDSRARYARDAGRSYAQAEERETRDWDLLPESITTQAEFALITVMDVTGSMSSWPITYRSKALYLDHELRTMYLSEDTDVAFCAFGDAHNHERFPLQVRPFARGRNEHEVKLGELVHTNGGGGQTTESSDLAALYIARNVHAPNARRKPIVIFVTDEKPYSEVSVTMARDAARVTLKKTISTKDVFEELMRKFSVYVILKPYNEGSALQAEITSTWEHLVGRDRIAVLPDETRSVDVTFGILAHYSGKIDAFKDELGARQNPDQVHVVLKALTNIFANTVSDGRSIMHNMDDGDGGEDAGSLC